MTTTAPQPNATVTGADLEAALAALARDYSKLEARIRELTHTVTCTLSGVTLRLHFPAFRQSKPRGRAGRNRSRCILERYLPPFHGFCWSNVDDSDGFFRTNPIRVMTGYGTK
jgi:hypothetical protein